MRAIRQTQLEHLEGGVLGSQDTLMKLNLFIHEKEALMKGYAF